MKDTPELREYVTNLFMEQMRKEKAGKVERYRHLNRVARKGQILFVGSSLMEQFPVNELLMDLRISLTIYNRGVGGFTTQELAEVLDVCVYELEPRYIFINIGTNDMNVPDYTVEGLISRYEGILNDIKAHLPDAQIFVMAYYPVNAEIGMKDPFMGQVFAIRTNERINQANMAVREMAERMGAVYLDANDNIKDSQGSMKAEYTIEGMHMYGDGYMQVLKSMLPILQTLT